MIGWLAFEKKPFQYWKEISIQVIVILLQLYTKGCSIKGIISQHLLVPNCAYRNETNEKVTFSRQYELMAVLPKVHTPGEFVVCKQLVILYLAKDSLSH